MATLLDLSARAGLKPAPQDNVGTWVRCIPDAHYRPCHGSGDQLLNGVAGKITEVGLATTDTLELTVEIPGGRLLIARFLSTTERWEFSWKPMQGTLITEELTVARE